MKRKNFLILLAAGCLFSCQQQDELQETSKEATNFSISIDDALSDPLTRTSNDLFPARNSITTGEVISIVRSQKRKLVYNRLASDLPVWQSRRTPENK